MCHFKLLAFSLFLLLNNTLFAAGFQLLEITDPADKALNVGVWYPSDAATPKQPNSPFRQALARDAKASGSQLPLVIISHGYGGWMGSHADLAMTLADAGFVVAAPTHTGNNGRDESYPASRWMVDRPRHVSRIIDYLHQHWEQRAVIETTKTAMYGFSAGGFTTMSLAGAEVNIEKLVTFCAKNKTEKVCEMGLGKEIKNSALARSGSNVKGYDPRIKAAVSAAPAFGFALTRASLQLINIPLQIWSANLDKNVPYESNVLPILAGLKDQPELHRIENAGHYSFISPCNPMLETANPRIWKMVCVDNAGFDRAAFHKEHNAEVLHFFQHLFGR